MLSMNILNWAGGRPSKATRNHSTVNDRMTPLKGQTFEAVRVHCTKEFEEANAVLRVLREVLIDHG